MDRKEIVLNNHLVSYLKKDSQAAKTAVFLHGWRSEASIWSGVVESLTEVNCYCLDLPGFGKSQIPKQAMTVSDYSDVVKEFIRKLDLQNVVLVGHSFGGRIAIKLASSDFGPVEKLVLVNSAGIRAENARLSFYKIFARILKPIFSLPALAGLRKSIYRNIGAEDYTATPYLAQTFKNVINEDLTPFLSKINCPTLIVWGDKDQEVPLFDGLKMNKLIAQSKMVSWPDAGHFSFLDKPEEFNKILLEFI